MSFREMRNLVEQLRSMGFSRLVSLHNFSTPNFLLVSEILVWAMKMVDANCDLSVNTDNEEDRVILIRVAALFFYHKLGVKLNTVRLYSADKLAVQELVKVTSCLYRAAQCALQPSSPDQQHDIVENYSVVLSGKELREIRHLASSIVMDAAALHDSLNGEVEDKIKREAALSRALDIDQLEATAVAALHAVASSLEEAKEATEVLRRQSQEIQEKIYKKQESLARKQKRLDALRKIKPAWQTEFESEESELRTLWEEYTTKHKNLAYLENQLEQLDNHQMDQLHHHQIRAEEKGRAVTRRFQSLEGSHIQAADAKGHLMFGSMTGNDDSSVDSETDSFLVDSGSDDDDTLTLPSELNKTKQMSKSTDMSFFTRRSSVEGLPPQETLPDKPQSVRPRASKLRLNRPISARPRSAQSGSGIGNLSTRGSVKGSERVSPLSASDDNNDDSF